MCMRVYHFLCVDVHLCICLSVTCLHIEAYDTWMQIYIYIYIMHIHLCVNLSIYTTYKVLSDHWPQVLEVRACSAFLQMSCPTPSWAKDQFKQTKYLAEDEDLNICIGLKYN